jgi:hypothetical protein
MALVLLGRAGLGITPVLVTLATPAAWAQGDPYKAHMENGVKLYNDRNYPAAVAEFTAAYEARPKANPLLNIALCEKALFHYPKAIAALTSALAKHGDTMEAADKTAAGDAIKEMRALLGTVTVRLSPPQATLTVDGEDLAVGAPRDRLELGPGAHRIEAHADGFAGNEQSVTVASGQTHEVTLELLPNKGWVTLQAADPRMSIAIDQRIVGAGAWAGMLSPGAHLVQMYGPGGQPYEAQILVVAGKPLNVRSGMGGATGLPGVGVVPVPPPPPPKKEDPPAPALPTRRGVYILGLGSILFPVTHPTAFQDPQINFGAGYGARVGFQVNNTAGFEATYEHSSIAVDKRGDVMGNEFYRILSDRVAVGLRLISPGTVWRFVGTLGGGFVVDGVVFGKDINKACAQPAPCALTGGPGGVDAFALVELGAELDVDRVLLDLGLEAQFQSTGNLNTGGSQSTSVGIYGALPIVNIGPAFRVGYRFW